MTSPASRRRIAAQVSGFFVAGLLTLGTLVTGCAESGDRSPEPLPRLILVTIDTLRADHLGAYGYPRDTSPNLDAFADEAIVFETCLSPLASTLPAHTSLLTGVHPLEHGILANVRRGGQPFVSRISLRSFAEFASERGYRTAAFVSAVPVGSHTGLSRGFELYDEPDGILRSGDHTNDRVLPWLDRFGEEPFFLWVHYYDPHYPYRPREEFDLFSDDDHAERYVADRRIPEVSSRPNGQRLETRAILDAYDGEVRFADDQVGRLFESLRQSGLWDDVAIVVTSDHGEGLGEHDMIGHGYIHREQLQVPLMIRVPGAEPRRVSRPVTLEDVLPTTLHLLGPEGWEGFLNQASGVDALAPGPGRDGVLSRRSIRPRDDVSGIAFTFTDGRWKYVHEPDQGDRLFDWSEDPYELDNRRETERRTAGDLMSRLASNARTFNTRGKVLARDTPLAQEPVDPEVLEKLRALGYLD